MLLAGCAGAPAAGPQSGETPDDTSPQTIDVTGSVHDLAVIPLAGANVSIMELDLQTTTGADGRFAFPDLAPRFYTVTADAVDHRAQTLTFSYLAPAELRFTLARFAQTPRNVTEDFHGIIQCAAEYLIITPSCDSITEAASQAAQEEDVPMPHDGNLTDDETEFFVVVEDNWRTIVVDIDYAGDQPGLEGLRAVVAGTYDPNELGSYETYGRFQGDAAFTFRIEPGGEYPDGVKAVPDNATGFRLDVYGQGHGWHATCAALCALGVGAGIDVEYDVYVTVFYVEAAPEGWTFLT